MAATRKVQRGEMKLKKKATNTRRLSRYTYTQRRNGRSFLVTEGILQRDEIR